MLHTWVESAGGSFELHNRPIRPQAPRLAPVAQTLSILGLVAMAGGPLPCTDRVLPGGEHLSTPVGRKRSQPWMAGVNSR